MPQVNTVKLSPGERVQQLRIACDLTARELAELAGVPAEHVARFEGGLPLPLDSKRRILRELWGRRARQNGGA